MNFGKNSNNKNETNVNTSATSFKNSEGTSPSAMNVGYWNSLISIKLHPPLDPGQRSENAMFNYDKVISTAITIEKTLTLHDALVKTVIPALAENKVSFEGVSVGENTLVGVGTTMDNDKMVAYFGIFKGLDENTKKPAEFLKYHFKTSYTISDYDHETGSFNHKPDVHSEVAAFTKLLESSVIGLYNSTVHADRHVNKYFRDKMMSKLDEIGGKLGIQPPQRYGSGNYSGRSNGGVFSGAQQSAPAVDNTGYQAEVTQAENIDELSSFM